jgi:hypothetical protein
MITTSGAGTHTVQKLINWKLLLNYGVPGLRPTSDVLEATKRNETKLECFLSSGEKEISTLLSPLETAKLNYWKNRVFLNWGYKESQFPEYWAF